jgi:hypothetical protein
LIGQAQGDTESHAVRSPVGEGIGALIYLSRAGTWRFPYR